MRDGELRYKLLAEINMIPLIDIVIVVLILFMITTPLFLRGIEVALPQATATSLPPAERLTITIERDGTISLDRGQVSLDELGTRLARRRAQRPDLEVYLKADRAVPYGLVVQAMDEVKKAGVDQLGIVTEAPGPSPARRR